MGGFANTGGRGLSRDVDPALRASKVTKSSGGSVFRVKVHNQAASREFLQFFNATSVPADATVPRMAYPVEPNAFLQLEWPDGWGFDTGIVWVESTTQATKTIAATAKFTVEVEYR